MQILCRILKRNFHLFANHAMMIQKKTTRNKFFFRLGVKASPCTNLCKSKYATSQDCSCGRYKKTTRRQLLIDGKATLSAQQRCWIVHHTCNASSISGFSFSVENRARKRRGTIFDEREKEWLFLLSFFLGPTFSALSSRNIPSTSATYLRRRPRSYATPGNARINNLSYPTF